MSRTAESESSRCIASNPFYNLSSVTGVKGGMTLALVILFVFSLLVLTQSINARSVLLKSLCVLCVLQKTVIADDALSLDL